MKKTLLSFLLDETGSMASIKEDTIAGFNQYVDRLEAEQVPAEFTLVKFDSNGFRKVCVWAALSDVPALTNENYTPGAGTPLIDAVWKTIKSTEDVLNKRDDDAAVMIVILTDGLENASREHTYPELTQLISEKTQAGWQFVFLGAGIDAFAQARQMGIGAERSLRYSRSKSADTFDVVARKTAKFARERNFEAFSPEERLLVTDEQDIIMKTPPPPRRERTSSEKDLDLN